MISSGFIPISAATPWKTSFAPLLRVKLPKAVTIFLASSWSSGESSFSDSPWTDSCRACPLSWFISALELFSFPPLATTSNASCTFWIPSKSAGCPSIETSAGFCFITIVVPASSPGLSRNSTTVACPSGVLTPLSPVPSSMVASSTSTFSPLTSSVWRLMIPWLCSKSSTCAASFAMYPNCSSLGLGASPSPACNSAWASSWPTPGPTLPTGWISGICSVGACWLNRSGIIFPFLRLYFVLLVINY